MHTNAGALKQGEDNIAAIIRRQGLIERNSDNRKKVQAGRKIGQ